MTFHNLLPNLRERAEGIKITYICDNARNNKNEEKGENIGTCCSVQISFESDLNNLARHHAKKTRKGAVYQLARMCTQERPGQSAKIIANADDICSRKQANEITEGLGTF